jgi:hypothetical protein
MSKDIIIKQGTGILATDTTKFEAYLAYLGLPTENIIAALQERQIIESNLPAFIESLPPEVKRDARYLSKFVAGEAKSGTPTFLSQPLLDWLSLQS